MKYEEPDFHAIKRKIAADCTSTNYTSYVTRYQRLKQQALILFPSLVGAFDCEDDQFYHMSGQQRLRYFGLGDYSIAHSSGVAMESRARTTKLLVPLTQPTLPEYGGVMYALLSGEERWSVIFLRRSIGLPQTDIELEAMIKLAVFFHELGHVWDFEHDGIFLRDEVQGEVLAHHFACQALIAASHRIALGWYLLELQRWATADAAAAKVVASRKYHQYHSDVSPFWKCNRP